MPRDEAPSIFADYYKPDRFVDRFESDSARAVDVIVPIIHTNELWRKNLLSIYREIPVNRLLIGDGGCIDRSVDIAREFPRVEVLDHRGFTSLGFSLRRLIEAVKTEWFVYLHSDVYLPAGWFDAMCANQGSYDWFECNQRITVLADYLFDTTKTSRSYSGSQMGRTATFSKVTPLVDDDFLYRNEDIIFSKLVERMGARYGKVDETFHFHQVMYKPSQWGRAIKRVAVEPEIAVDEDIRANRTYAQGIIKYLEPGEVPADLIESVRSAISRLIELDQTSRQEFLRWVEGTRPAWLPHLSMSLPSGRRNTRAEKIHVFAERYRHYGAGRALWLAAREAMYRPTSIVRNLCYGAIGGCRRMIAVGRADGLQGVVALFTRRFGRRP